MKILVESCSLLVIAYCYIINIVMFDGSIFLLNCFKTKWNVLYKIKAANFNTGIFLVTPIEEEVLGWRSG